VSDNGAIRRVRLTIRGLPPGCLMNGKGGMVPEGSGKKAKPRTPEEEAELAAHWTKQGKGRQLALPWVALYQSVVTAAGKFRFKGNEKMTRIVAATISCEERMLSLGTDKYTVHADWVRIPPKTGGMVIKGRALVPEWRASAVLLVDDEFYEADRLREVVRVAGKLVGVLANRPENRGEHGKFTVEEWEVLG
jgi:hypothetical protein